MTDDAPRIQIDDDWKSEAAREKARLAETVEEQAGQPMPAADFVGLIQLIAMQAVVGLGGFAGPGGHEIPPNLELAKHHIDMLEVIETKTKGNLTDDEKRLVDTTLHQLRMAYVEALRGPGPGARSPKA